MYTPVLSVIMPVYNAEKYVYEAIDSILKQTFTDFEFLIFNDCSTDSSREVICSFPDTRIRIIDSPVNTGYVKHLNEGLGQAKGKYIARMDADDIAHPDRFQKQLDYLRNHEEVAACGSWMEFMGAKNGVLEYPVENIDIVTHLFLFGNAMAHPSVMLRKSVLTAYQLSYNAALEPAEDYELWNNLSEVSQLHNIPEVLLKYRIHDRNESVVKKAKQDQAVMEIRKKMIERHLAGPAVEIRIFISGECSGHTFKNNQLANIRHYVKSVLNSGRYNNQTIKRILSNRFVACCKMSDLPGYLKMMHYVLFPKHFFSIRICLSLFINK